LPQRPARRGKSQFCESFLKTKEPIVEKNQTRRAQMTKTKNQETENRAKYPEALAESLIEKSQKTDDSGREEEGQRPKDMIKG